MRRNQTIHAFTLAELLIAISITLIIILVLFQVFAATANQWQSSDQRIDTFRDARAALQIMTRDLSRADVNGNTAMLTLSNSNGTFATEAYAITPIPNSGKSDLCAVGYYCAFDLTTKAFSLRRLFKDSNATYTSLATASPNFTAIYTKDLTLDETAAAYIWDLQFRPGLAADPVDPAANPSNQWKWLEIRFKSMSPAAARKIRGMAVTEATWLDNTTTIYKSVILPYEQQFVSRVALHQPQ